MEELFTRADSQISILQLKLEHDEKQSDLLKKEIHFLEETKKTNQEEKVHLKSRIQMVEDQIEGLNEKNLNLQTQKENMELTVKEKETKIELLSFNKEKMEQMVQSSSDLEIKYREKLEENHKTLIELAKKEEEYIENIKSLEGKVTEQEMEVLKLTSKLVEKETKIGSYREEQEKLKSQTSAAEKKLVDFQNEYKSVMDKFESMENQITDITIQNKNLQSRQGKFKELEEEITKSSSELHKLKQEKANTNKEITRLKEDNKNFIKDLTMKIEEVNATKTELAKMQAELKVQEEKAQIQIQAQKLSSSEKLIQLESSLNKAQSEKQKTEQELSELRKLVEGDVHSKPISQIKEQNEQLLKENAGLQRSLSEVNAKFEEGVGTQKEKEMRIQELENQIMVNKLKDMSEMNEEELKAQVNEEIKNLSKELEDLKYEKLNKETEFEMKIMKEREKSSFALEENENQIHQLNQKVTSLSNIQTTEPYLKLVAEFEQSRDQNDQLELSQVASQKANLTLKQEIISLKKELFLKESTQSSLFSELAMLKQTFSQRANSASDDLALSAYAQLFKLLFHKLKELTLPTGKLVFADAETEHELDDEEEKAEKIPSEKEIVEMSSKIQKSLNLVELKFEEKDIIGENVILLKEILYLYQTLMTLSKERMEKKQGKSEQVNELVKLSNSLKDKLPNKKKLMIINTVNKDFFPFLYRIKIGTDTVPLLVPCIRTEIKHRQMKLTTYQDEFSKFRKIVTIAEGKYSMYEQKLKLRNNNIQP
jgi:predicted  nucleic acid-binding Zn-ribbon protein